MLLGMTGSGLFHLSSQEPTDEIFYSSNYPLTYRKRPQVYKLEKFYWGLPPTQALRAKGARSRRAPGAKRERMDYSSC